MKIFSVLLFFHFMFLSSCFAFTVDERIASKLAKDSYLTKSEFAKIYKTKKNIITTAKASGVRYFVIKDNHNTIIVIRGTDNIRNAITDVMAVDSEFLGNETLVVHQGFYDVSKKLFKAINLNPKKPVVIVGHSLGGAVSLLYGAMLVEKNIDVSLYTFGMPPIANKNFLQYYKKLNHHRYFHIFDPVASLSKPTIQLFETQIKFKSFQSLKGTISNMITTIQNIPDKFRHHGNSYPITDKLNISEDQLNDSLFFKTCTLYFDYHKIDNYIYALSKDFLPKKDQHNSTHQEKKIRIIPSVIKGTTPLEVEFYIETNGIEIDSYYFNFAGKEQIVSSLKNNKISHTFYKKGNHNVMIALKDKHNKVVSANLSISTREPTFQEYQNAMLKDFNEYMNQN